MKWKFRLCERFHVLQKAHKAFISHFPDTNKTSNVEGFIRSILHCFMIAGHDTILVHVIIVPIIFMDMNGQRLRNVTLYTLASHHARCAPLLWQLTSLVVRHSMELCSLETVSRAFFCQQVSSMYTASTERYRRIVIASLRDLLMPYVKSRSSVRGASDRYPYLSRDQMQQLYVTRQVSIVHLNRAARASCDDSLAVLCFNKACECDCDSW